MSNNATAKAKLQKQLLQTVQYRELLKSVLQSLEKYSTKQTRNQNGQVQQNTVNRANLFSSLYKFERSLQQHLEDIKFHEKMLRIEMEPKKTPQQLAQVQRQWKQKARQNAMSKPSYKPQIILKAEALRRKEKREDQLQNLLQYRKNRKPGATMQEFANYIGANKQNKLNSLVTKNVMAERVKASNNNRVKLPPIKSTQSKDTFQPVPLWKRQYD